MRDQRLIVLIVAMLAAGCGGSSSTSAAQLRAQATRICTAADQRAVRLARTSNSAHPETFLTRGLLALRAEYRQLRRLRAAGDAGAVYSSALAAMSGELGAVGHAITALERHQDPVLAFRALQARLSPLERQANSAWNSLGVSACAS